MFLTFGAWRIVTNQYKPPGSGSLDPEPLLKKTADAFGMRYERLVWRHPRRDEDGLYDYFLENDEDPKQDPGLIEDATPVSITENGEVYQTIGGKNQFILQLSTD